MTRPSPAPRHEIEFLPITGVGNRGDCHQKPLELLKTLILAMGKSLHLGDCAAGVVGTNAVNRLCPSAI
jgi:hypothetical protein